jgi:hypothetical protein
MTLTRKTTRHFHKTLYAGMLQKIYLIKRDADQGQGTTRTLTLFQCRRSMAYVTGEPLRAGFTSNQRCTWHIPRVEMDRVGVDYISALDRIVDPEDQVGEAGVTWMPESGTQIVVKLFGNHICVDCLRTDSAGV